MDRREAAQDDPVADLNMTRERGAVGKHGFATDLTVVGNVRVRHEQVVVADAGDALVVGRAAIHGAVLAKHVAVAYLESGRLALVFLVLRGIAEGGELENVVVGGDRGRGVDDNMRTNNRAGADLHVGTDNGERSNSDVRSELRLRRNNRSRVDHLPVSG